jgi:hypothetical protein
VADPLSDTIYAGGSFTTIGGQSHVGLGKIAGSGAGAVDATWTPALSSSSSVSSLVLADGSLYLGGTFKTVTSAGSSTAITRNRIARLSPTTGILDASWDPSANGQVSAIVVDSANGVVYLGGSFLTIGTSAVSRQRLARVSESGSGALDLTWNPAANSGVNALAFDSANSLLYVAGSFTTMTDSGGSTTVTRNRLGRVSTNSGLIDPAWTPAAGSSVAAVALSSDASTLLAGGSFATIGATTQLAFAALSVADGTLGISPEFANMGSAASIGHQSNGGIIVGGSFVKVGTAARTYLLRLNADGSLDANFNPVLSSSVSSIAIGADDSVYITGFFQTVNGIAESSIAKLDGATGATNTSWSCPLSGSAATMVESGGSLYIGGTFTNVCGAAQNRLAKLDATTGARDATWVPNPSSSVNALVADTNGTIYVGGSFTTIAGATLPYLAALDGTTGAPATWNAGLNSTVNALALDGSGALYAGGAFITATVGGATGVTRNRLLKLDVTTGLVDSTWSPNSSANVSALQSDGLGSLYVATNSSTATMGGVARPYLSKVGTGDVGAVSATWNPTPNSNVNALAKGSSGEIYAGGGFSLMGTTARAALAALPPGPASTTNISSISPEPSVVGQAYTVNVGVTTASGTPTGSVTVSDDVGATCIAILNGGTGNCTMASSQAGSRRILATYRSTDFASSSASTTHTVVAATTQLSIDASTPTTSVYGGTVTVAYTFNVASPGAGTPSGQINTTVDGTPVCTVAIGVNTCMIGAGSLNVGQHLITVAYAGDANFGSSSTSTTLTVTAATVAITLGNLSQVYDGTPHAPSVTTNPPNVGVSLAYAGGSAPVNAGSYSVIATSADPNYVGSATATFVVAPASTVTTITTIAPSNPTPGQTVTVSYSVASVDAPSGNVTVLADSGESCVADAAIGKCTISFSAAGNHSLTATYAGDTNHASSASAAKSVMVTPATLVLTLGNLQQTYNGAPRAVTVATTPANVTTVLTYNGSATPPTEVGSYFVVATSGDPNYSGSTNGVLVITQATSTVTILGATPLNALAGQPVTVRYLVTSVGTPTGNVTIFSASGEQCTATVAAGECALTFSESSTRVLAASYNGDKNHQSSMSTNFDYGDLIFSDGFE